MAFTALATADWLTALFSGIAAFGVVWAVFTFYRTRRGYPRLNKSHAIHYRRIANAGAAWLRVIVSVENVGDVKVTVGGSSEDKLSCDLAVKNLNCCFPAGFLQIQRIEPWTEDILQAAHRWQEHDESKTYLGEGNSTFLFGGVDDASVRDLGSKEPVRLEPGEREEFIHDFLIDNRHSTVAIYSTCPIMKLPMDKDGLLRLSTG